MFIFQCSCSAAFTATGQLEDHIREEQARDFQDRQLYQRLIQRLEQSLSHSKADCDNRTSDTNDKAVPDKIVGTEKPTKIPTASRFMKHRDRDGYHCPLEECDVKPVDKLAILRDHYATRKICHHLFYNVS